MIDAFFWPKVMQRRHYKILVRPTLYGEFLVFPHGYRLGGHGWILSLTQKARLEAARWTIPDSLFLLGCLGFLVLSLGLGLWCLFGLIGCVYGWYAYTQARWRRYVPKLVEGARQAPVRLTRARYRLEYASQIDRSELWWNLAGCGVVATFAAGYLGYRLASMSVRLFDGIALGVAGLAAWGLAHTWERYKDHKKAFTFSVRAGDPVYFPLPEPE